MKRPEPELYDGLKAEDLFGEWKNSETTLNIACTGSFDFVEKRYGHVFNKDIGSDISNLNKTKKEIIVSTPFGKNTYYYHIKSVGELEFLVGKRSSFIEASKNAALWFTWVEPDLRINLTRVKKIDCDKAPHTFSEVMDDMGEKLKNGEFKQNTGDN